MDKVDPSQGEQAVRLWEMLELAARKQQLLTQMRAANFAGIAKEGLAEGLARIHAYCKKNGYPLLNCLVVNAATGLPGDEFPEKMDRMALKVEQAKVFDFNWADCEKPKAYEFMIVDGVKK
jgi:hypothetical protein